MASLGNFETHNFWDAQFLARAETRVLYLLVNIETDEIINFPSIYKAAKFIDQAPLTITYWGKKEGIWNNKYKVILQ